MSWTITPEKMADAPLIEALIDLCFGPGRFAKTAYRLREGVQPVAALSLTAWEDGTLRGSLRFWPIAIAGVRGLILGPLAVQPDQRGRGIGIDLMQQGILKAQAMGVPFIILVGDEPYYGKVGFKRLPQGQIEMPGPVNPARLLGLELVAGALAAAQGLVLRVVPDEPVAAAGAPLSQRSAALDPPGPK
ncbi:MAG: N-acetyltransferase [Alphaproteobacteria bacterium]|nr:N-acetyltransferase [Alphaproteobacteria bacterium]